MGQPNFFREENQMLVLSRKAGEQIKIGDDVTIVVRRVAGNRVTIGVDAPEEVRVLRGELHPFAEEFDQGEPAERQTQHRKRRSLRFDTGSRRPNYRSPIHSVSAPAARRSSS